jgi:DNA-binding PadR family transcriptional regulator
MFGRGPKVGRGDVRAAIIALLAEEPMHGYQIITELTERSGGVWHPSPGSVYPTLQALEDQGLVTANRTEGRRVFSLTDEGKAAAEAAGDGPAPWEDAARGANRSLVDLRGLMFEVGAAILQVGRTGSDRQIKAVGEILTDTRRRIYLVLADGSAGPAGEDGTGGDPEADTDTDTEAGQTESQASA